MPASQQAGTQRYRWPVSGQPRPQRRPRRPGGCPPARMRRIAREQRQVARPRLAVVRRRSGVREGCPGLDRPRRRRARLPGRRAGRGPGGQRVVRQRGACTARKRATCWSPTSCGATAPGSWCATAAAPPCRNCAPGTVSPKAAAACRWSMRWPPRWGSFRAAHVQVVWCDLGQPLPATGAQAWAWLNAALAGSTLGAGPGLHAAEPVPARAPGCRG